jgi:hypothetical protein
MDKTNLTILVVVGVIFLVVGAALGIFYQVQRDIPSLAAVKTLSSKVIPAIAAYGDVTKVDDRNVTLSFNGDSLTVRIKENSPVVKFARASVGNPNPAEQKVDFKDIKVGDSLSVSVKVLPDGQLEGVSVIILPPAGKAAQ